MKILIIAATTSEIDPFLQQKDNFPTCDYLITGVGMTQTAYMLGKQLATQRYDLLIHVGIAGCFDRQIPLGTVIHVQEEVFSELGAENDHEFIGIEELGFGKAHFKAIQNKTLQEFTENLPSGLGITVNTVHGNEEHIALIKQRIPAALVESMEGGAVFLAATQEQIYAIQLRAISNYVEKRNRAAWNIPLAIKNCNDSLIQLLKHIFNP